MKGINIKFPISDNKVSGSFFKINKITKEALSSNLLLLLLTEKGERYYMPDFGTNLLKYIFEPSDNITVNEVRDEINQSVKKYIPGLTISEVDFNWILEDGSKSDFDGTNQLNLKINFVYNEGIFTEEGEIELTF